MNRLDQYMGFLLKYENVAWFENGQVRILDRRVYPMKTEFVYCNHYSEVCWCIKNMVTQSIGPYIAAAMGMVLATYEAVRQDGDRIEFLTNAAYELSHQRPTTAVRMEPITAGILETVKKAVNDGKSDDQVVDAAFEAALEVMNSLYRRNLKFGEYLFPLVPDDARILTHCYGESIISGLLSLCKEKGKTIHLFCDETRPYFQGARLTASISQDMGFDTTVITDGMAAVIMQEKKIDLFTTGADMVTMDGHVTNKVGTFHNAIACRYLDIPFYPAGNPVQKVKDRQSVVIEYRNENEVLDVLGQRITMDGVRALYPAFDITPPELITGIVTDKGIFEASEVGQYHNL